MLITNAWIYHPDRQFRRGWLRVEGEQIADLGEGAPGLAAGPGFDAGGLRVVPGFTDLHVHGSGGADLNRPDPAETHRLAAELARHGVTSWLPTVAGEEHAATLEALHAVQTAMQEPCDGAEPLGIHLEGPFLHPERRGAFRTEVLQRPTRAVMEQQFAAAGGLIRRVTLAPELPGAAEVIEYCRSHGAIPIMGHSNASFAEAEAAFAAGVGGVTHCCNAMRPLHHREPGNVTAALLHRIPCEFIMDGVHVHPAMLKLAFRCLGPEAMLLITDAGAIAGLPDGDYFLYGEKVTLKDGQIRTADGTLAGSVLTLDRGVRNAMRFLDLTLEQVLPMTTTTPLNCCGVPHRKGLLAPGRDADLVLLDDDLAVARTMVRGRWVFQRG